MSSYEHSIMHLGYFDEIPASSPSTGTTGSRKKLRLVSEGASFTAFSLDLGIESESRVKASEVSRADRARRKRVAPHRFWNLALPGL